MNILSWKKLIAVLCLTGGMPVTDIVYSRVATVQGISVVATANADDDKGDKGKKDKPPGGGGKRGPEAKPPAARQGGGQAPPAARGPQNVQPRSRPPAAAPPAQSPARRDAPPRQEGPRRPPAGPAQTAPNVNRPPAEKSAPPARRELPPVQRETPPVRRDVPPAQNQGAPSIRGQREDHRPRIEQPVPGREGRAGGNIGGGLPPKINNDAARIRNGGVPGSELRHRTDFGPRDAGVARGPRDGGGDRVRIGSRDFRIAGNGYRPSFNRHNWYRGHWGGYGGWGRTPWLGSNWGYYGPGGGYGWGWRGRPLGWGLGAWGLGSLIYGSGYLPYYNPYYGNSAAVGIYDYSQPIPVVYDTGSQVVPSSNELFQEAVRAFRRNDTDSALNLINDAVSRSPDDAALHEFRALVLFAKSDYQQAAATIHSVLALGPGWDWATLSALYDDVAVYTLQLRALEQFVTERPRDAGGRFLLAYHYLSTGHPDAAARHLEIVAEQVPEDHVAADLLKMLQQRDSQGVAGNPQQPAPQPPEATLPANSAKDLAQGGVWRASRSDGSKFELTLAPDANFSWKFIPKDGPPQEFTGTYSVDGNVLALERRDGGSLIGEIAPREGKAFNFKLLGAPPDDQGLEFRT